MSKTSQISAKAASTEANAPMRGCDIVVRCLENEGVEVVFAYPGGASMEIHQALTRSKKSRTILPRHEQGGAFAAEGYGRAPRRAGGCRAATRAGAANRLTGTARPHALSVSLVAIPPLCTRAH